MPPIIRNWNTPNEVTLLSGHHVVREEQIFLSSHKQWYRTLPTGMHFVYKDPDSSHKRGSTILCTCGSAAGVFGHQAYKRWTSVFYGNEVISCTNFLQYGVHGDGSHE